MESPACCSSQPAITRLTFARWILSGTLHTGLMPVPGTPADHIFCSDRSGHLYAAGGLSGSAIYRYDVDAGTWTAIPALPFDHGDGACTVTDSGYLYVSDGMQPTPNVARIRLL